MQTEKTLIDLGFHQTADRAWMLKGRHQLFKAEVELNNPPVYVRLFLVRNEKDLRKHSTNYGKPYISPVKDCCSNGSIERALNKYDIPTESMEFVICGIHIK